MDASLLRAARTRSSFMEKTDTPVSRRCQPQHHCCLRLWRYRVPIPSLTTTANPRPSEGWLRYITHLNGAVPE